VSFLRSLPPLIVMGGLFALRDQLVEAQTAIYDTIHVYQAKQEIAGQVHMMETDAIANGLPSPETYAHYLRDSGTYKLGGRDASQDPWETPYKLEMNEDGTYCIRSAGPDKQYGTEDDVTVVRDVPKM
jgi:hypothetical protein